MSNFFRPIGTHAQDADDRPEVFEGAVVAENEEEHPVQQIESLCMECGENGMTNLLLTSIPYFKEVILSAFRCEHCGNRNNEIQSAGQIQDKGAIYTIKITSAKDLDRQLVRSDKCTLSIPEYELTIPPTIGQMTTVEGVISDIIKDLSIGQPVRKHTEPEVYDKIQSLIDNLRKITPEETSETKELDPERDIPSFTLRLDDPSGNSFAEPINGLNDPKWSKREYSRTKEQNVELGLAEEQVTLTDDMAAENPEEVLSFPDVCSSCGATLETYMKKVDIPHFKEVMLMSTNCHSCGYRDNEIKSGGAIAEKARKITLQVEDDEDLKRDILKSETSDFQIPEIGLELNPGTLGGRFTTLEGLLNQVFEELDSRAFARGDSTTASGKVTAMEEFLGKLKQAMNAEIQFTVILDDPLANSYIQNPYAPDEDPKMTIEYYKRSFQQDEELGLNDIQTEEYEGKQEALEARQEADAKEAEETKP